MLRTKRIFQTQTGTELSGDGSAPAIYELSILEGQNKDILIERLRQNGKQPVVISDRDSDDLEEWLATIRALDNERLVLIDIYRRLTLEFIRNPNRLKRFLQQLNECLGALGEQGTTCMVFMGFRYPHLVVPPADRLSTTHILITPSDNPELLKAEITNPRIEKKQIVLFNLWRDELPFPMM